MSELDPPRPPGTPDPEAAELDAWLAGLGGQAPERHGRLARALRAAVLKRHERELAEVPPARLAYLKRRLVAEATASARKERLRTSSRWLAAAAAVAAVAVIVQDILPGRGPGLLPQDVVVLESGELATTRGAGPEHSLALDQPQRAVTGLARSLLAAGIPVRVTYRAREGVWLLEADASAATAAAAQAALDALSLKLPADGSIRLRVSGKASVSPQTGQKP